jgi:predicted Zn finger-like uncharacterized protein
MSGTTACPHCGACFKITKAQLAAHHGMVRCGHCMEAFDTRPNFVPEQLDLQLELPILDESISPTYSRMAILQPMTLAEQVAIIQDDEAREFQPKRRTWPWTIASLLSLIVLLAQIAYFFRIDLAARLPNLKPALIGYCQILKCTVPLPQHTDLISIESSELQADPVKAGQITLNALLRNRAPYAQAFPNLELTLNDSQDQPLARRVFRPAEYLPPLEKESVGLLPNYETTIQLPLNITELRPMGYRLVLFYPNR